MKKINKAAADDWHQEERARVQRQDDLDQQRTALFYAANKRDGYNFPCARTLESLGFHEAAMLVRRAYGILGDAEVSFRRQEESL